MTNDILIRNVRPMGGAPVDIRIHDGTVTEMADGILPAHGEEMVEGAGRLALPGLINAHTHLDKTRWGLPWQPHAAGPDREERIAADRDTRDALLPSVKDRAAALVRQCVAMGTSHIRTHVDVEPKQGLAAVEPLLTMADEMRSEVDLDLVAFPQFGVMTNPGTAEMMEQAVRAGAAGVGGIDPSSIDGDPAGQLDAVFTIAERTGAGIDIHLHETGEEGARSMAMICERTGALGMAGRVAISHAFCLGTVDDAREAELIEQLAKCGVAVVTYAPGKAPIPPLKVLRDAGVTVAVGTDGIRDAWTPYGNGDMLERAMMLAYRSDFRRDEDIELALDAVISGGADLLGLERHGVQVGAPGDLVLIGAETVAEAVVARPQARTVIKRGRQVG